MKAVIITLALAGLASAATVDAQILGTRLPTPSTNTSVGGSWSVVGRDGSGYTIYERRVRDANGNIVVQRARRDANGNMTIISSRVEKQQRQCWRFIWFVAGSRSRRQRLHDLRAPYYRPNGNIVIQRARRESNGNMTIISSRTVANNGNGNYGNCDYNRTSNSVGDIIFGRTNDVNCDDNGNRVDGGWYQVGRGRDNNSIYERRTRDREWQPDHSARPSQLERNHHDHQHPLRQRQRQAVAEGAEAAGKGDTEGSEGAGRRHTTRPRRSGRRTTSTRTRATQESLALRHSERPRGNSVRGAVSHPVRCMHFPR